MKYHHLPTLEEAGIRHFKLIVFDAIKEELSIAILQLIDEEREGGVIDRDLIRQCVQIYEQMGMGSLDAYISDLEVPLLESTR